MKRRGYRAPTGVVCLLSALAIQTNAWAAPPDDGFVVEDESPEDSEDESPDDGDGFELEDESEDGFELEDDEEEYDPDVAGVEGTVMQAAPSDDSEDEGDEAEGEGDEDEEADPWDGEFVIEDISDDEEALEADMKEGEVQATGTVGTVSGRVIDSAGEPIPGAYVEVVGQEFLGRTGIDGSYSLDLPPGTYTIVAREELHQAVEQPGVVIDANNVSTQDFKLAPVAAALVVEVAADANVEGDSGVLLQRQKKVSSTDSMSRAEISRSGGGKLTNVARRIVGATVVDGRFVFVRGLGHRYGNTLFDGARVPSPEPELRTVPLDIFPSGALGAINVQKSFTPDVPADFAGGSIQLVTREIPDGLTFSIGIETEANTVTSLRPMVYSAPLLGPDFFGFGNGPRGLPQEIPLDQKAGRGVLDPDTFQPLYTDEELEAQGEAMYTDTQVRRGRSAPFNGKLKLTVGNGWRTKAGKIGVLASASYSNGHQTLFESIKQYGGDGATGELDTGTPQVDFRSFKTVQTVRWSALGLARWDFNDKHRLEFSTLYSRDAEDETRELRGIAPNVSGLDPILSTRLRYIMRSIWFNRLGARHRFPIADGKHNVQLDYFGAFSQARRDDPGIREMLYLAGDGCDLGSVLEACEANSDTSAGAVGDQTFLALADNNVNGAFNLEVPFDQWSGLAASVKLGAWAEGKWREFGVRRFSYQIVSDIGVPEGTGNIINDGTVGSGISGANGGTEPFVLRELTRPLDNYRASQNLYAGYAMLTLPVVNWAKLSGGARLEANEIDVQPFDRFAEPNAVVDCEADPDEPSCLGANLRTLDVLPSFALIFSPKLKDGLGKMNVRLMGSRTLARPEFRELAPFAFTDFVGGFNVLGNPDLDPTYIWNAEARWEWFPKPTEVVAVTAFYKNFDQPIEQIVNANTPATASFVNAKSATNIGAELELRKGLDFMAKKESRARGVLRNFSLGANFAYVYSRVQLLPPCYLPGEAPPSNVPNPEDYVEREDCKPAIDAVTSRERPLQGQSPFVVNAFIDYDNQDSGTFVRLMFNTYGRRIFAVSTQGLPDIYEEAVPGLDLVFSQRLLAVRQDMDGDLHRELRLSAGASNLINPWIRRTQGGERVPTYEVRKGVTFSMGLSWSY